MTFKRFTIAIVSALCAAGAVKFVIACADGPSTYDEPSFFLNTINKQSAFVPFYYAPYLNFYTDGYDAREYGLDDSQPDKNIVMWKEYTNGEVSKKDIDSFVYRFPLRAVRSLYNNIKKGELLEADAEVKENGFTQWLISRKDAEAVNYLAFAKECEPHAVALESYWDRDRSDYVTTKRDSVAMQSLVKEAIKRYEVAKKPAIRLRYAYQAIRMAFYSGNNNMASDLFNSMITTREDNYLYYRSLSLKAGALYRAKKNNASAYLYSLVFDRCDELKKEAYTGFKWAVNGKISPLLALCKNEHEKAVIYVMQGLYDYDGERSTMLSAMQNAYSLDPKVRGIDILMTRSINKAESTLLEGIATTKKGDKVLNDLNTFAKKAAADGKSGHKAYWLLSSAYIYTLSGDIANTKKYLDLAAKEKMTANEQDVHYIITALYTVRKNGNITAKTEEELLPSLREIEQRAAKEKRYSILFSNIMLIMMKNVYVAQGNMVKAVYCYSKTYPSNTEYNFNDFMDDGGSILEGMTPQQLHHVEAFIRQPNKSEFELWLTENTVYNAATLYELEGTKFIREYSFDSAIIALKRAGKLKPILPDVMVSHLKDEQDLNSSDKTVFYTKLDFAKRMQELEGKLRKNPKDSRAAYQYANGLYSMSYYGKGHHAYDYYRSSVDQYAYYQTKDRARLDYYQEEHYSVTRPEKYYMIAFENTTDKEMKARCLFMAAKCWQKSCPSTETYPAWGDNKDYYLHSLLNPHFAELKKDYSNTDFYNTATGTCSYFRDYVKNN